MNTRTTPRTGDHVQLLDGKYEGCILSLIRVDTRGDFVCKRSSWPYEVKAQAVRLYRMMPEAVLVSASAPVAVRA